MTFDKLWQQVLSQNPQIAFPEDSFRITGQAFKKAIRLGYEQGVKEEAARQDGLRRLAEEWRQQGRDDKSIFEQIFGKGFKS